MISKFEARTAYNSGFNLGADAIIQTWKIPPGTVETGHVYWEEQDGWYHLETYQASETYAEIFRLSPKLRVVVLDAEAWVLRGPDVAMALYVVLGHHCHESGLLAWDQTQALWVTPDIEWYSGQIASDELTVSEISANGFAYGTGYSAEEGKIQKIKLDLNNQKVIQTAYIEADNPEQQSFGHKIRLSALLRVVSNFYEWIHLVVRRIVRRVWKK